MEIKFNFEKLGYWLQCSAVIILAAFCFCFMLVQLRGCHQHAVEHGARPDPFIMDIEKDKANED